jgi:TolA-binding protein
VQSQLLAYPFREASWSAATLRRFGFGVIALSVPITAPPKLLVALAATRGQNYRMRWLVCLFLFAGSLFAAEPGEAEAFAAAAKASHDGFYERAEKEWSAFLQQYPKSDRAAEAALAEAQARHQLKQYSGALEILNARAAHAGPFADQYQFWRGQVLLDSSNYTAAEQAFAELVKTQTNSPLRLNASVAQAQSRFRRDDFQGVVELLGATNSVFQETARTSTNVAQVARGYLTLAEAQLRRNDLAGAGAALQALATRQLPPDLAWERWQLVARVEFAGATPELALPALTNAATQARAAGKPLLLARTLNLQADIFQKLNQPTRAAQTYEGIVSAEGMPPEQKRIGLLREVDLYASQNLLTNAATRIVLYLAQNTNDVSADALTLKAGEFWLDAYRQQTNKVAAPATNYLNEARASFDGALQRYTNSPLLGKAWLDRGWALWEEHIATSNGQRLVEAQAAFRTAADKLPAGEDQAQARFKLGDTQFEQGVYSGAATNFQAILTTYANAPNVRANLVAQAAEQLVRCDLAQTNLAGAEAALQQATALFPTSENVQSTWIVFGQTAAELGQVEKARAILKQFSEKFPNSKLADEAELAYARTFALEEKWPEAIEHYTRWTTNHMTHPLIAQAEFDRAWLFDKAGQSTNAFNAFTNFIVRFQTNLLAARAQNWVGDYFFKQEQWDRAEQSYQRVFQNTNWDAGDLECHARMMAARTAFFRQNYGDAIGYLTNILQNACSPSAIAEAYFEYGDVLIEQRTAPSTNTLQNFKDALVAFSRIVQIGPTNRLEPLAWGKIGDCHLQLAADPNYAAESYERATNAYQKVLDSKRADVPIKARNQAEVGIATALEKMAETRPKERIELLKAALAHHLNVVYSKNPAPYWQTRAAREAARLAVITESAEAARALYKRFIEEIPAMRTTWEAKLAELPPASTP